MQSVCRYWALCGNTAKGKLAAAQQRCKGRFVGVGQYQAPIFNSRVQPVLVVLGATGTPSPMFGFVDAYHLASSAPLVGLESSVADSVTVQHGQKPLR